MIAADSSSLVAYFQGDDAPDVAALAAAIANDRLCLPPVVVAELLSFPKASPVVASTVDALPHLELLDGYWERAGKSRASLRTHGLKARLADTLVAQSCIDHGLPLIARDGDFRHFVKHCGLILA